MSKYLKSQNIEANIQFFLLLDYTKNYAEVKRYLQHLNPEPNNQYAIDIIFIQNIMCNVITVYLCSGCMQFRRKYLYNN